jgi:hypothetical protein
VVFKYASRQVEVRDCVVVGTAYGVVCVRAVRRVGDWAQVVRVLLGNLKTGRSAGVGSTRRTFAHRVLEGLSVGMLRVPDSLGLAIAKAHHYMLPVADVVSEVQRAQPQHFTTPVVAIEEHVEGIYISVAFVIDNDCGIRALRLAVAIGSYTLQPIRVGSNIILGCQVDVTTQLVETVEVQRIWR